ncbi:MAG: hypothetical protein Q8M21_10120 [Methylococcaceae bacterium]|nr:hypothetical protein [Methylococcaceae bacterium]
MLTPAKHECDLMVMSESFKVQATVYDRMVEISTIFNGEDERRWCS